MLDHVKFDGSEEKKGGMNQYLLISTSLKEEIFSNTLHKTILYIKDRNKKPRNVLKQEVMVLRETTNA